MVHSQKKVNFCVVCSLLSTVAVILVVGLGIVIALSGNSSAEKVVLPLVINTWAFTNATAKAWEAIYLKNATALDTVEVGCTACEEEQCDGTVGFGGSPDENGETTLDAFMMDGATLNIGAVGALRRIKPAASVARRVLENTQHSILAGELATQFAVSLGFKEETLTTNRSQEIYTNWKAKNCQPNYWMNVTPNPSTSCGPYSLQKKQITKNKKINNNQINKFNHDTISMLVIDSQKNIAAGTSSNGANHKIPGRVGDAPIVGAGAYADNTVGGAACTGDGDVMMRFLPSFLAVEEMRRGASPTDAAKTAILRIAKYYPKFSGAIIVANIKGEYGAACHGLQQFPFSLCNPNLGTVTVMHVSCEGN